MVVQIQEWVSLYMILPPLSDLLLTNYYVN
jgi:hypothetical protein